MSWEISPQVCDLAFLSRFIEVWGTRFRLQLIELCDQLASGNSLPMKNTILVTSLVSSLLVVASNASVTLQINVSNPSAVTVQAVAGVSQTDSSLSIGLDGITLENLFTTDVNYPNTTTFTGDLSPSGTASMYNGLGTFDFDANDGVFTSGDDLSMYFNGVGTQVFDTSTNAFTGVATIDFSSTPGALPAIGTSGNIYSGYFKSGTADHGEIVGQWQVVPEPSSATLLLSGACIALVRRRRS